jgi:hypothetical protein
MRRPAAVEGIVRNSAGDPVAGAKVVVTSRSHDDIDAYFRILPFPMRWSIDPDGESTTAADGSFRFDGLASFHRYTVYVIAETPARPDAVASGERADGDVRASFAVHDAIAGASRPDLVLVPFPRVQVRILDHGKPSFPSRTAQVQLDGHGPYSCRWDESGWGEVAPELGGLGLGRHRITLEVGAAHATVDVDLKPGAVLQRDVTLLLR